MRTEPTHWQAGTRRFPTPPSNDTMHANGTASPMRLFRVLIGLVMVAALLAGASWAVRDCQVALLVYENCIWLDVRDALGLPQSKLLRALLLQAMGFSLLGGMYLSWRYVFPRRERTGGDEPKGSETAGKTEIGN